MSKGLTSIIQRLEEAIAVLETPVKSASDLLAVLQQAESCAPPTVSEATRNVYGDFKRSLEVAADSDVVLYPEGQPPHPDLPVLKTVLAAGKALEAHRASGYRPRMSSDEYVVWAECDAQLEAEFCSLTSAMYEEMQAKDREDADEERMIRRLRGATREVRRRNE